MPDENLDHWLHTHSFGQDRRRPGEIRTITVVAMTFAMMTVEIVGGVLFGSMALLADGLHMASHAAALSINAFAYVYGRRHAHDERFSFGTGKVNALGGFTGAVLLVVFALMMAWKSADRMINPVEIAVDQAILVAIVGLVVNGFSALILNHRHEAEHHASCASSPGQHSHVHHHHTDHNLRSAYLHVMADALTSLLAIIALLGAKFFGLMWMDPLMGIIGALVVWHWSLRLSRASSSVLLDHQAPTEITAKIRSSLESEADNRVTDLHVWSIGPNLYGVIAALVTRRPKPVSHYKLLLPAELNLAHVTVEIQQLPDLERAAGPR